MEILFPHDNIRDIQKDLVNDVDYCIKNKKHLVAHAPTGLGKTAASLAPAMAYALENKKTIFFLTSRHTQHKIAIDTLRKISEKHRVEFTVTDIIGKKHMCLQPGVERLFTNEFFEYCKGLREDGKCDFYNNTYEKESKTKLSVRAKHVMNNLKMKCASTTGEIKKACFESNDQLCPYEISQHLAKDANVIIADYYYIFNDDIRGPFLKRIGKELEDCIIIVDEAHNLPQRIRELMTTRLTTTMLDRALNEAKKEGYEETGFILNKIKQAIELISADKLGRDNESLIIKDDLKEQISKQGNYQKICDDLEFIGTEIRKEKKRSYIASIAEFLMTWDGDDEGFVRFIRKEYKPKDNLVISYRCLDPGIFTSNVASLAHSVIMMSGTLTPPEMYRDLIGIKRDDSIVKEYDSPFPEKNRLCMIIPETSTKYTSRSEDQYKRIAEIVADVGNRIKGNIVLFFPSYYLRDNVAKYFNTAYEKTIFTEMPGMTTEEKHNMIEKFKSYKETGAALLGASSGSYGEGIDLPGELLKGVIVIGLPLQKPDLETKELINYYDKKFNKGWDYGYLFPAFNKTLQNAGRCIRSKDDKGIIVFLDERYAWRNYYRCFPKDMKLKVTKEYRPEIVEFLW